MATHGPALSTPEGDFAGQLLAEREVAPRAEVIAQEATALLQGCAINVYLYNEEESPAWPVKGRVGEATVEKSYEAATLTRLAETRDAHETVDSGVRLLQTCILLPEVRPGEQRPPSVLSQCYRREVSPGPRMSRRCACSAWTAQGDPSIKQDGRWTSAGTGRA